MDKNDWEKMQGFAEYGLKMALQDGRGVDALAMMEALQRIEDKVRNWRLAQQQMEMMSERRG